MKKIKFGLLGVALTLATASALTTTTYAYDPSYNTDQALTLTTRENVKYIDWAKDTNGNGYIDNLEVPFLPEQYYNQKSDGPDSLANFDLDKDGNFVFYKPTNFVESYDFKLAQTLRTWVINNAVTNGIDYYNEALEHQRIGDAIATEYLGQTYENENADKKLKYKIINFEGVSYTIIDANGDGIINPYQYDANINNMEFRISPMGSAYYQPTKYSTTYTNNEIYDEIYYTNKFDVTNSNAFRRYTTIPNKKLTARFWQMGERLRRVKDTATRIYSSDEFTKDDYCNAIISSQGDFNLTQYAFWSWNPLEYKNATTDSTEADANKADLGTNSMAFTFHIYDTSKINGFFENAYGTYYNWFQGTPNGSHRQYYLSEQDKINDLIESQKDEFENNTAVVTTYDYEILAFETDYDINRALYIAYRQKGYTPEQALSLAGTYNPQKALDQAKQNMEDNKGNAEEFYNNTLKDESFMDSLRSFAENWGSWLSSFFN